MSALTLDDADGYAQVEVRTAGGPLSARLDLYEAINTYTALAARHPDDAVALGAAWCDWLAGKGLPGLSHGAAFRLADHVAAEVEAFKKKGHGSPSAG